MGTSVTCLIRETPQSETSRSMRLSRRPVISLQLMIGSVFGICGRVAGCGAPFNLALQAGGVQDLTEISLATEVAPGADHAVEPASWRAFQVVTIPVSLILPPSALTLMLLGS
jgi:hypothetical protein